MKIAILGPKGTFSHQVLLENYKADAIFTDTIREVFKQVSDKNADKGIVPIENSIGGTIGETIDSLSEFNLQITKEIEIKINHNLCSKVNSTKITSLLCHPQTYSQCQKFIRKKLPKIKIDLTTSNSESAKLFIEKQKKTIAAILPKKAAEIYNIPIIKEKIQDKKNNTTRFIEISKKESTGNKTTLSITPSVDKPGLLYEILGYFANNNINLTKIESRPSGKLDSYIFFLDIIGNKNDPKVKDSFAKIKKVAKIRVYGSYETSN